MKTWIVLLWVALVAVVYDVHTNYVPNSKYNDMIAASQKAAAVAAKTIAAKPAPPKEHHYQLVKEGFRTFRFDPGTGDTCIQLTTPDDWKKPETKRQQCEYLDALRDVEAEQTPSVEEIQAINCLYDVDCPKQPKKTQTGAHGPWEAYSPAKTTKVVTH